MVEWRARLAALKAAIDMTRDWWNQRLWIVIPLLAALIAAAAIYDVITR